MMRWLDADTWHRMWANAIQAMAGIGLRLVLICIAYWLARQALLRVVDGAMTRLQTRSAGPPGKGAPGPMSSERIGRLRTMQTMVKSLVGYALFFVFVLTVLQTLEVNITGILTTAGVAGVAAGLGAQKLVRDMISGFFIVSEDHFAVGDFVTIGPAAGIVEELSLRTTRVRDEHGRVWIVPNGDIGFVLNQSRGPVVSAMDIPVSSVHDVDGLMRCVNEMGAELRDSRPDLFRSAPTFAGLVGFDAAGVTARITFESMPHAQAEAQMALHARLRESLIEAGYLPQPPA